MAGRKKKQRSRRQQRLWPEGQPPVNEKSSEPAEPVDPSNPKSWTLDAKTKRVGRAGLAAARKRIRRPNK